MIYAKLDQPFPDLKALAWFAKSNQLIHGSPFLSVSAVDHLLCNWTLEHLSTCSLDNLDTWALGHFGRFGLVDLGGEGEGKLGGWAVSRRELTGLDFLQQAGK